MKKHPILIIFLVFLAIFISYFTLIIRDIFHIKDFLKENENNRSSRVETIGIKGLCLRKDIDYDYKKQEIESTLKNLTHIRPDLLDLSYDNTPTIRSKILIKKEIDQSVINELLTNINGFDEAFNISSIKDFEWDVTDPEKAKNNSPMINTTIISSYELSQISLLIAFTEDFCKKHNYIKESSLAFRAMLKNHLLCLYINKGNLITSDTKLSLDALYVFYDKLIGDMYTQEEMQNMLSTIKQVIPLIPEIKDNVKIQYYFSKRLYDHFYSEFPVLAYTVHFISGSPYLDLEKINELLNNEKYKEVSDYSNKRELKLIFISPAIRNVFYDYNDFLDIYSRLPLIQANLEYKLGKEITAIDPFDKKPIRYTIDNQGKKVFYCLGHQGTDKGTITSDNISNCDTKLKLDVSNLLKNQKNEEK